MTQIKTNLTSYSEHHPEKGVKGNWAAEYAKREVDKHREAEVLDHPDGSVTKNKLSPDVRETIADAKGKSETAKETADNAKVMAQSAKDIADIAKTTADSAMNLATEAVVTAKSEAEYASETARTAKATAETAKSVADIAKTTAEDAFNYSDEARGMANDADARSAIATATAEEAEQRATSAEAKADTAVAAAGSAVQKAETVHGNLEEHINNSDVHTSAEEKNTWNNKAEKDHTHDDYATHEVVSNSTYGVYQLMINDINHLQSQIDEKANKPSVFTYSYPSHEYEFNYMHNCDIRNGELTTLSFTFGNGEYVEDYASGLSFDSGETPTAIDYTDSGILNWVGTDCATSDGLSIFQPSANTHYDIVFYFNGVQFIGLVNGFVPATGNEAV